MSRVPLVLLSSLLAACGPSAAENRTDDGAAFADRVGIPASRIRYFPAAAEQPRLVCNYGERAQSRPIVDEFENRWFSQHLTAAEEPSLYLAAQQRKKGSWFAFRFTWLRSFHAPVFIRIETAEDGKYRLSAKELSGAGGYDPGTIKKTVERELRPEEVQQLRQLFARTHLVHLPPKRCEVGCDGADWIFEIVDDRGYHVLMRWSPVHGPVRDAGMFLMRLSGWQFADVY